MRVIKLFAILIALCHVINAEWYWGLRGTWVKWRGRWTPREDDNFINKHKFFWSELKERNLWEELKYAFSDEAKEKYIAEKKKLEEQGIKYIPYKDPFVINDEWNQLEYRDMV